MKHNEVHMSASLYWLRIAFTLQQGERAEPVLFCKACAAWATTFCLTFKDHASLQGPRCSLFPGARDPFC